MRVKVIFDFHDIFVYSEKAWLSAFVQLTNSEEPKRDYRSKMPKKDICRKYDLDYAVVEEKYRKLLKPIPKT
jgi:hypothetical protein